MKAQRCVSPVQAIMGVLEGKAGKPSTKAEATQVLMYMDRLQQLVPQCPKDRPVSRLELIQFVIDYIYDLEDELAAPRPQDENHSSGSESESNTDAATS